MEKYKINAVSLRFYNQVIEDDYQETYFHKSMFQVRVALLLGIFVWAIFGVLDSYIVPSIKYQVWAIRFAVAVPTLFLVFILSFTPVFKKTKQLLLCLIGVIANLGLFVMFSLADQLGSYLYPSGSSLLMVWIFVFSTLRFRFAILISVFGLVTYNVAAFYLNPIHFSIAVNHNFFIISTFLIGGFACYSLEYYSRNDYLKTQITEQALEETRAKERELQEALEKLKELDQAKTNFFANISHEIRTPLTLILSPIESVLQGDYQEKPDQTFFKNLQKNAIRLLKLINNLLDYSKIEAGRFQIKVQETDVVKYLKTYFGAVQSTIESKELKLDLISTRDETNIYLDIEKMEKIMMNLFSNALKFTNRGGQIKVVVKEDDSDCYIEFSDTGIGIPSDKLDSIFDRFSQVDSSSTRKYEGTGIGLALTKELVEMHGGSIKVASKFQDDFSDDHGTTFVISFRKGTAHLNQIEGVEFISQSELSESISDYQLIELVENEDNNTPEIDDLHAVSGLDKTARVLVVEDNLEMRDFLSFLLDKRYAVSTAINGEEGLKKAKEMTPDLIVTDVMMPIMNGYELTQKIKGDELLKSIPILMLTAKSEITNKIEGLEHGADDYLTKPFNSKELLTRIRSLLKTSYLQKELIKTNEKLTEKVEEQLEKILKSDELKKYLPSQLVNSILKGEKATLLANERRRLTVFFSDIKKFTELTEFLEAEELSALLNDYLTEMTRIANKWGGTIDKVVGDAIMIFFGAPEVTPDKDNALNCVKMAIDMQKRMRVLQKKWYDSGIESPLEVRIGISTGTATVGNFGASDRLSYTVIGSQVNIASRLETICEPNKIKISHPTWALVRDEITCTEREKVRVKGINREIVTYDVVFL